MNGNIYCLMHRDEVVCMLELDEASGDIIKISKNVKKDLLPLGARLSGDYLKIWWSRRAVPIRQRQIEKILEKYHTPTPQSLLVKNMGLSLVDHYWIKPMGTDYTWSDVNLYENDFLDEIGEFQIQSGIDMEIGTVRQTDLERRIMFCPSASSQGELLKKWVIGRNKKRYLVKGNKGASCQQSINETVASQIHKRQEKMPYVNYQLCDLGAESEHKLGCVCENFSSARLEFIPAYDVVSSAKKKNDVSQYEHFIGLCTAYGLAEEYVRCFLEYQILADFVMTNVDRHFNNFGVLRDTNTLQFVGMAPIFDTGNSMFWNLDSVPKDCNFLNITVSSFRTKETDLLRYVQNPDLLNVSLLPDCEELAEWLARNEEMERRLDGILMGYERKLYWLERFQAGEKIWKMQF